MGGRRLEGSVVLVTGGGGFIGSHLCDSLLAHGNRVVCLDSFATGRKANLASAAGKAGFTLIEGDIRDLETCRRAAEGVRVVFHQLDGRASMVSVLPCWKTKVSCRPDQLTSASVR